MFGIPAPWLILGGIGIWAVSMVGASLTTRHYVAQGYELRLAQESAASQKLLTQETARRLSAEQKQAEANNQIEETRAKAQQDIDDASADFNARLARSVRPQRKCASDSTAGSKAADNGSSAADAVTGLFVPKQTLRAVGSLARAADEWVAYGHACHDWSLSVGR